MYKREYLKENVKWYAIDSKGLCLYNDKKSVYRLDKNEEIFNHNIELQEIICKEHFFINDFEGKGIYFDDSLKTHIVDGFINGFQGNFIVFFRLENEIRNTILFDIEEKNQYEIKFATRFDFISKQIYARKIFENNSIEAFKFPNGISLWQYSNFSKFNWMQKSIYEGEPEEEKQAEVIKFLGVYKNELWLVLNSGALLALNIETGIESRYIKEGKMIIGESDFEDFKGYFGYDTVIDEESGLIFNLNRHFYVEYNLNYDNTYFDSYSFKESSQEHKLNLNYVGGFDEAYIYSYEGSDNNRFAIFSREKKEVIWSSEIEEVKGKFPAIRDLQYGAEKIYVLDHDNTLHIFEKE